METARLPKNTELTGEGNHMTRHVKNLWKFSSLYGCVNRKQKCSDFGKKKYSHFGNNSAVILGTILQ